jgi:acyl carrier protein
MVDVEKRSTGDIVNWLVTEVAKLTRLPREQVRVDEPLANYLFDSRDALNLAADLETWLGIEMSASLIWDHPTIEAIAEHVAGEVLGGHAAGSRSSPDAPR